MRVTLTFATLPAGPYVTQYGRRARCTLLAPAEMGQPQNYGRCAWDDATTPRTDAPVRFRRVAMRRRNVWGTGWDHFSKSETYAYR